MEEAKLIRLRDGIEKQMTCSEVFTQFERLLHSFIKSWTGTYEYDDLFSLACVGLTKAYNSYDAGKGNLFTTYLGTVVNNEIFMFNRKERKQGNLIHLEEPFKTDNEGGQLSIGDMISDETDYEEIAISSLITEKMLSCLKEKEREAVRYWLDGLTGKEIGERFGVSRVYGNKLVWLAIERLRKKYKGEIVMKKEELLNLFKGAESMERQKAIAWAMDKYGYTRTTAQTYYYDWKKVFMGTQNCIPSDLEKKTTTAHTPKNKVEIKDAGTTPEVAKEKIKDNAEKIIDAVSEQQEVKKEEPKVIQEVPKPEIKPAVISYSILKPTDLSGKVMKYRISETAVIVSRLGATVETTSIILRAAEVEDFIAELQELKSVLSA